MPQESTVVDLPNWLVVWASLAVAVWTSAAAGWAGDLADLAKPHAGRSRRSTSTAVDKNGNYAHSNSDNSRVAAGATKVVLDAQGPGVITHMWFTFLGPEPHRWAPDGSANHQEILLRIYYDENPDGKTHSWNERQDDYSSVAFWYQTETPTFTARASDAKDRTLPNLDLIFPAKPCVDDEHHGAGQAELQANLGFFPQGQLFYQPEQADGAWIEIPFTVEEKEPRRLLVRGTRAPDYGRYEAYLNGVKLGRPIDLYDAGVSEWEWHLLDFWPDPGEYTLRLECVGKNPKSTGYFLGIESVRLRERRPRVKAWARDRDKDWRKAPILYE